MIKPDIHNVKPQLDGAEEKDRYSRHLTKPQGEMFGVCEVQLRRCCETVFIVRTTQLCLFKYLKKLLMCFKSLSGCAYFFK